MLSYTITNPRTLVGGEKFNCHSRPQHFRVRRGEHGNVGEKFYFTNPPTKVRGLVIAPKLNDLNL
jgi:hypothetical protein